MNTQFLEIEKWDESQKTTFFNNCLSSFGSMNKTDYETALFWLLLKNHFKNTSDFEISLALQIPESKVKNLRYQVQLKYPEDQKEIFLFEIKDLLINCKYRVQGERIQFAITDKMQRLYLYNLLNKDGRFADTSFNVNIVSLSPKDFLFVLVMIFPESEGDLEEIKNEVEKEGVSLDQTVMDGMKGLLKAIGKDAVEKILPKNTSKAVIDFVKLLKEKIENLINSKTLTL